MTGTNDARVTSGGLALASNAQGFARIGAEERLVSDWAWAGLFAVTMVLTMGASIATPMWYLSSRWSGWSALERDYRATTPWKGPRWRARPDLAGARGCTCIHAGTGHDQTP
jgi:hypothetical protein